MAPAIASEGHHEHGSDGKKGDDVQTLTGEVVDLMCYLDHAAMGEKHRECAKTCIESGGPVGLLVEDKVYLVIGEHKPINNKLAPLAAQTVTLKGKVAERAGMRMLENAEIVKK
ncbi:MAG: hypothetical protein HY360_25295 [Verrucomicrobia bacterium]|nr:hypothetical protein [Verrucomicrobiota bacterium]